MTRDPNTARPMMVNNRIAGTRITVWDVLHSLETGGPGPEIAETLHLNAAQMEAVAQSIEDHQEELLVVHRQIAARKARGNPPAMSATLARSTTKLQAWLLQQHATKT